MSKFEELIDIKKDSAYIYNKGCGRAAFVPDLGARVFCELDGISLHQLDIENVCRPDRPFNNYGGNNFWPAPEGGSFGFNYQGQTWVVQAAINDEPFVLKSSSKDSAIAEKKTILKNRKGTDVEVVMWRRFMADSVAEELLCENPEYCFSYTVEDKIKVLNEVKTEDALLACWTLEQFEASDSTFGFVRVENPSKAINFDFYEHPGDRITYKSNGFIYKMDSQKAGQIGIKTEADAELAGFYDLSKNLICIRQVIGKPEGIYFNIADNDQPDGPYSASDNYSIFNGAIDQGFFEIETIATAITERDCLKGSELKSKTSFAIFKSSQQVQNIINKLIGI